jgi:hypothetical protein
LALAVPVRAVGYAFVPPDVLARTLVVLAVVVAPVLGVAQRPSSPAGSCAPSLTTSTPPTWPTQGPGWPGEREPGFLPREASCTARLASDATAYRDVTAARCRSRPVRGRSGWVLAWRSPG